MTAPWMAPTEWPEVRPRQASPEPSRPLTTPYSPRGPVVLRVDRRGGPLPQPAHLHARPHPPLPGGERDDQLRHGRTAHRLRAVPGGYHRRDPERAGRDAGLVDPLAAVASELPDRVNADFHYPASLGLHTTIDLPYRPPNTKVYSPYDEIRGVRGVKHEFGNAAEHEYTFTLQRLPNDDALLNLQFTGGRSHCRGAQTCAGFCGHVFARFLPQGSGRNVAPPPPQPAASPALVISSGTSVLPVRGDLGFWRSPVGRSRSADTRAGRRSRER